MSPRSFSSRIRNRERRQMREFLVLLIVLRLNYRLCSSQSAYEARLEVIEEKDSTDF